MSLRVLESFLVLDKLSLGGLGPGKPSVLQSHQNQWLLGSYLENSKNGIHRPWRMGFKEKLLGIHRRELKRTEVAFLCSRIESWEWGTIAAALGDF